MEILEGRYYKNSKRLMELIGLWPDQSKIRRFISQSLFLCFGLSLVLPQIVSFRQHWKNQNYNIMVEITCTMIFISACNAKYTITFLSYKRINLLILEIVQDWQRLTDKIEISIMFKYYEEGRMLIQLYTLYMFGAGTIFGLMPFLPYFLDIVFPLDNATHPLIPPIYADYVFFKQENHHYFTSWHCAVVYLTYSAMFAAVDGTFVATVKHICGLFAIICYRLESLTQSTNEKNVSNEFGNKNSIYRNLANIIVMHNQSIRCFELLENSFSACFTITLVLSTVQIPLVGFYLCTILHRRYHFFRLLAYLIGVVIHMAYLNFIGQQIIDSSKRIFDSAYYSKWYTLRNKEQIIIKIIMMRSFQHCQLTASKLAVLSMQTFGVCMKTSMSYFTVFKSVA